MRVRLVLVAAAIAIPSWVALMVLLGNVDLQRSLLRGLFFLPLERPLVFVGIGLIAFTAGLVAAMAAGVGRREIILLAASLAGVNLVAAIAATFLIGELELRLPDVALVFVALAAGGALYLGGLGGAAAASLRLTGD